MKSPQVIFSKAVSLRLDVDSSMIPDASDDKLSSDMWRTDTIEGCGKEVLFIFTHQQSLFSIIINEGEMSRDTDLFSLFRQRLQASINDFVSSDRIQIGNVNTCKGIDRSLVASMNYLKQTIKVYHLKGVSFCRINHIPLKSLGFVTPHKSFVKLLE